MTIGQLFENIPTHLAVDDIATLTFLTNLASTFASSFDLSSAGADVAFTLDNGTDVGQLKILCDQLNLHQHMLRITVSSWGYSSDTTEQIILDTLGNSSNMFLGWFKLVPYFKPLVQH